MEKKLPNKLIVWIEVELHSDSNSFRDIAEIENLSFTVFKRIGRSDIWVKLSEEYYSSTIEYNFTPFDLTEENLNVVKNYLQGQIKKFNLKLFHKAPSYVGLHVHIFNKEFFSSSKPILLKWVMNYLANNLEWLNSNSIIRLFWAHQLWAYYSEKNGNIWHEFNTKFWFSNSSFDFARWKTKYQPIISSPATSLGKPQSIEIRLLPNEYILDGRLFDLLSKVEDKSIIKNRLSFEDYYKKLANSVWFNNSEEYRRWTSSYGITTDDMVNDFIRSTREDRLYEWRRRDYRDILSLLWDNADFVDGIIQDSATPVRMINLLEEHSFESIILYLRRNNDYNVRKIAQEIKWFYF